MLNTKASIIEIFNMDLELLKNKYPQSKVNFTVHRKHIQYTIYNTQATSSTEKE